MRVKILHPEKLNEDLTGLNWNVVARGVLNLFVPRFLMEDFPAFLPYNFSWIPYFLVSL
jgi:hypothetical protein